MKYSDNMIEKSNRFKYNLVIYASILIYILIYIFFVYTKLLAYSEAISASFFAIIFSLSLWFYGVRKNIKTKYNNSFFSIVVIFTLIYFAMTYGIGFTTGFLKNSYSLKPLSIFNNTFFLAIIIILEELLRYNFIKANKDSKKDITLITILLALLDIILTIRYDLIGDNYSLFSTLSSVILPSILKNIMCSYLVYYTDYKATIFYRLLTELYVYIVPIQPDLNDYINSICLLILPFIIIINLSRQTDKKQVVLEEKKQKYIKKIDIPFIVLGIILYCLICGVGPYKLVGIETGSMTPNLNIGDAVLLSKTIDVDKLKVDDIIAYKNKDNVLVIHRIIKINHDHTFITKGDYNNVADREYVKKEQIKGKVIFKIPYIAYPAIMFK